MGLKFPKRKKPTRKRAKRPAKRRRTTGGRLGNKCDSLFSRLVRERDGRCMAAGVSRYARERLPGEDWKDVPRTPKCNDVLQCAHIVSRRYKGTRWSFDNAITLCSAHHVYWTFRPLEWDSWISQLITPEKYTELKNRAMKICQPDYQEIYKGLESYTELSACNAA